MVSLFLFLFRDVNCALCQDTMSTSTPSQSSSLTISKQLASAVVKAAKFVHEGMSRSSPSLSRSRICDENDAICKFGTVKSDNGTRQIFPPGHVVRDAEAFSIDKSRKCLTEHCLGETFETEVAVVNLDTISASLALIQISGANDCVSLSFANDEVPGGYYRSGAHAQEEDLCCAIPELYRSLSKEMYPIPPGTALLSRDLFVVRSPKTLSIEFAFDNGKPPPQVTIITAAMPRGLGGKRPPGGFLNPQSEWFQTVHARVLSVLLAAKVSGKKDLVLGAFGAGAFGNPPRYVAEVFKQVLTTEEIQGHFRRVVFAIVDPMGTGNLKPFKETFNTTDEK